MDYTPFVEPFKKSENEVRSEALKLLGETIKDRGCVSYVEVAKALAEGGSSIIELLVTIWKLVRESRRSRSWNDELLFPLDGREIQYFSNLIKYAIDMQIEVTKPDRLLDYSFVYEILPEKILCEIHGREFSIDELKSIVA